MDNLATLANDSTNELLVDSHCHDAWYVWLVILARLWDGLVNDIEYVQATIASLTQSLLQNLIRKSVALDIHLSGSDTVDGTSNLEVHVTEVILVAEDVAQYGMLNIALIGNETHGDTCHWALHLNTGVEQSQSATTNCSHR